MKQELRAGATLDVLTKEEFVSGLREWQVSLMQGAKMITFSSQGTITAAGALSIGGDDPSGKTGPEMGFMWMVRRVCVQGPVAGVDPTSIYLNTAQPTALVYPNLTGTAAATGYKSFNAGELVLRSDEHLIVASTAALVGTGICTLTGAALLFPVSLAWKYL